MKDMTVRNADRYRLDDLYALFGDAINAAEPLVKMLPKRARPYGVKCIAVMRQFVTGDVATDDVKAQFKAMTTTVIHEVPMNDLETKVALCLAEVAHAAAHLGHLATSMSHVGGTNREYDSLQTAYVVFGLEGSKRYAAEITATMNPPAKRTHGC